MIDVGYHQIVVILKHQKKTGCKLKFLLNIDLLKHGNMKSLNNYFINRKKSSL